MKVTIKNHDESQAVMVESITDDEQILVGPGETRSFDFVRGLAIIAPDMVMKDSAPVDPAPVDPVSADFASVDPVSADPVSAAEKKSADTATFAAFLFAPADETGDTTDE